MGHTSSDSDLVAFSLLDGKCRPKCDL